MIQRLINNLSKNVNIFLRRIIELDFYVLKKVIDTETKKLTLYQFHMCPFCVRVRRMIDRLNLKIDYRDAKNNNQYRDELLKGGGKIKAPCLRIEEENSVKWLYESLAINTYLSQRF